VDANSFFSVSKLGWAILAPSHLLLWLVLATALALLTRRERLGRVLAAVTAVIFVVFGVLPFGAWLTRPLEAQYPRPPTPPAHVDGILTLGGGLGDDILETRHAPATATSEARLVSTYELARRYPGARVVFSGGWGRYADATAAGYVFSQLGLDPARLTLESRSRDTFENLAFTQALVKPQPGQVWLLATSAIQMPRAMAVAHRLGWNLVPWPTDYLTTPQPGRLPLAEYLDIAGHLLRADAALHEWIGLWAYRANAMGAKGGA
jgi:uncharacterized SAM-binding protein YcdF (DUF218 family)